MKKRKPSSSLETLHKRDAPLSYARQRCSSRSFRQDQSTIQALLESASQAILAVNEAGKIVLTNGMTESMFGYRRRELLGQSLDLLVPEDLRSQHRQYHVDFFANPRTRPMGIGLDLRGRRKDCSLFPVEVSLGFIETAEGRLAIAFVSDITERKRLETAVKQDHEQIRALASCLMTAQEEERRRVAREIHDDFCQELAALAFDLGEVLAQPLPRASRARLGELQARLAGLSAAARQLAYQLHPSTLEDLGLAASLRTLCDEASHRNGVVVAFKKRSVPHGLPLEVMSCLYRIAQEGLRNAIKHSRAKHVTVTLVGSAKDVRLAIRDDGVGFDLRSAKGKGGLGLTSMEERIRLVGGNLLIKSALGHGTCIIATSPLSGSGS